MLSDTMHIPVFCELDCGCIDFCHTYDGLAFDSARFYLYPFAKIVVGDEYLRVFLAVVERRIGATICCLDVGFHLPTLRLYDVTGSILE
jgi:hypothetical protein